MGWHALTSNDPLPEAPAPTPDLDKVLILLTDGTNTQNRWTGNASEINARMRKVCANIKAANVKVHTVRVIDGSTIATNLADLRVKIRRIWRRVILTWSRSVPVLVF